MNVKIIMIVMISIYLLNSNVIGLEEEIVDEEQGTEAELELERINSEEEQIIEDLYILEQEISASQAKADQIQEEIKGLGQEVEDNQKAISLQEESYNAHKDLLENVLVSYQKAGPASFIDIILSSEDLRDLIKRVNILKDLAKGTGDLMETISEDQALLEAKEQTLLKSIGELETQEAALIDELQKKEILRDEQEAYLTSLTEDRAHYEAIIEEMNQAWERAITIFGEMSKAFSNLVESGELDQDAIQISLSLTGIKATIGQDIFNTIILNSEELPAMTVLFLDEYIEIEMPDIQLLLQGNFVADENNRLIFKAESGTFYDVPLEENSIEELFLEGALVLDINPLMMAGLQVKDVESKEGELVLTIRR